MKFGNFEKLRNNAKNFTKAAMITVAGLGAGSAMGQSNEVPTQTGRFLDRLKELELVDQSMSKEEFAEIAKDESKIKILAQQYKAKTGALTRDELPKGKEYITISRTAYGVDEKEEIKQVANKKEIASFDKWYAKQKDGDTVLWPVEEGGTGLKYKIDRNSQNKSLYATSAPTTVQPAQIEEDESMASANSSMENFSLLKDKKFK